MKIPFQPGIIALAACLTAMIDAPVRAQELQLKPTGYLADASEEYWPADSLGTRSHIRKNIPILHGKGSVSNGVSIRNGFESFRGYLWGIGPQDGSGYLLHRILAHSDLRYSKHLRVFAELQSSLITGRNGGPRPIQDLNKLVANQLFAQVTIKETATSRLKLRLGKQHLNYGQGTLLDLRDANVRRSFLGGKLQLETAHTKLDIFAMKAVASQKGLFDDTIDHGQKIGGLWITRSFDTNPSIKIYSYYLLIRRENSHYNQGSGRERRHTTGIGLTLNDEPWFSFSELDFQWGKLGTGKILAWKIAPSLGYRLDYLPLHPVVSIQAAISSGDSDAGDGRLETFNPIYPKAIFYGFIDNAGSSNLIVIHPKTELRVTTELTLTLNYYQFWRQNVADGIYAVNGSFLLPASDAGRHIGEMIDLYMQYRGGKHWVFQLIGAYYARGSYLKGNSLTKSDILYFGLRTAVNI
ncbi:alginate export family protein [Dyadobacter sp. OTU695]|uniref:alginate export family protein n=1 Tax=Dyadobacter sp. OTU695 TaxID=3043860 RepID=UPI00313F1C57